jgi:nitrogen fixation NifU-like protein
MYSPQLIDHFEHPRNAAEVASPDATAQIENPACGDILKLSVKVVDGQITNVSFRAKGCVPTMACGSAITELVKGKTIAEAAAIRREQVVEAVGGLPQASEHASYLAVDTLRAVLKHIKR